MSKQGMKDNAQHLAGMAVGLLNRLTGRRYSKSERASRWFSTASANLVADRAPVAFLPYA